MTTPIEEDWQSFGSEQSAVYLAQVALRLLAATKVESGDSFSSSFRVVEPALTRVHDLMAEEYGFQRQRDLYESFKLLPPVEAARCVRMNRQAYAIDRDPKIPAERKVGLLEGIIESLEGRKVPFPTSQLWIRVAFWRGESGQTAKQKESLQRCIARSYEEGRYRITCQALGVLGSWYESARDIPSMMRCFREGLQVARKHRLPEQTGRLLSFESNYHASRGHLALARELLQEATEVCDEFGGAPSELRFLGDWFEFNARLGCWDLVANDLRRADHLLERYDRWWGAAYAADWGARFEDFAAYIDLLEGRLEKGNQRYLRSEATLSELGRLDALARLRTRWAQGLRSNGRYAEAQAVLERGLRDCPDSETEGRFTSRLASLHARRGNWAECEQYLLAYESLDRSEWLDPNAGSTLHDVTRVRFAKAREDWEATRAALHQALRNAMERLGQIQPSQEGNLALREFHPLRDLLDELVSEHAEAGMALEFEWRRLPSMLGQAEAFDSSALASIEHIVSRAQDPTLESGRAGHGAGGLLTLSPSISQLIYRVDNEGTVRWWRSGAEVRRTRIEISRRELGRRVSALLAEFDEITPSDLRSDPSPNWVAAAHRLAVLLLPPELLELRESATRPIEVLVSQDGCLHQLPLGVLSARADRYLPLIEFLDVQYLGQVSRVADHGGQGGENAPGVIVADPRVESRYASWGAGLPPLRYGRSEAAYLLGLAPESLYFAGDRATKSALVAEWQHAPFLYFATHVVSDPEASYLSYLPLSPGARSESPEENRLDLNDLSSVHFDANPTVVLSACSSGASFLVHGAHSPGLGEGFLRAGASTVIQNLWSVQDEATSILMQSFVDGWIGQGMRPDEALNAARRQAWEGADSKNRHPYYWGGVVALVRMDIPR